MKQSLFTGVLILLAVNMFAAEVAILENLGFNPDGMYFMFGQHVFIADENQAYAELGVVDVKNNTYVRNGWKKRIWDVPVFPNQDSRGALYELLSDSADVVRKHDINHLQQGRLLFSRVNDDEVDIPGMNGQTAEGLVFRDFDRGREYTLVLNQEQSFADTEVTAGFSIDMAVRESWGTTQNYVIGRVGYYRPGVSNYEIVRVWTDVSGNSVVIALAKQYEDLSIRYMVETIQLP